MSFRLRAMHAVSIGWSVGLSGLSSSCTLYSSDGEHLARVIAASRLIQLSFRIRHQANLPVPILRLDSQAGLSCLELEELAIAHQSAPISPSATAEHDDCITSGSSGIEIHASFRQGTHYQCRVGCVVVHSCGDEIPLLVRAAVARLEYNRDQVRTEVPGRWVDEEALARGGFQRDR